MRLNFQLLHAIQHGSYDEVQALLDKGANPSATTSGEQSALTLCDHYARVDVARLLIQRGANLNERIGPNQDSLLHRAIARGNLHFAKLLLESGIHPDMRNDKGMTPLHMAAQRNLQYFTNTLLEHGAFPYIVNRTGNTPLHIAARHGHVDVMKSLIKAGSDASFLNSKGLSPLDEAVYSGNVDAVTLLLDRCKETFELEPELVDRAWNRAARSGNPSMINAFVSHTGQTTWLSRSHNVDKFNSPHYAQTAEMSR